MTNRSLAVAAVAAAFAALPAAAQNSLTPRSLGMAGAYMGVARGQESLYQNPANLGLANSPHWSVAVPQLVFGVETIGIEPGDVWDLREFGELTDAERQAIVDDVPESGTGVDLQFRAPIISMQIGRAALGLSYGVVGTHSINRSLVDLVLNGVDQNRLGEYNIQDTEGFRASFTDLHLGYGRRIGPVALGATGHYYFAGKMVRSAFVEQQIVADPVNPDVRVRYTGLSSEGGNGFGLDLGAAMEPIPGLTVGLAVDNVVNTLTWDGELNRQTVVLNREDYETGDAESIFSRYDDSDEDYVEATANTAERRLAADLLEQAEQGLPMTLRVGGAYSLLGGRTTVGATYQSELDESTLGGLWQNQLSVGVQQRLPIVTLRAGLATDMESGSMLSGGLTLGPIQLGIARIHTGSGDEKTNGWVYSFALAGRSDSTQP